MSDTMLSQDEEVITENSTEEVSPEVLNADLPEWLSGIQDLPDDIRMDPSLKVFNSVDGLVKSYVNAQKMVGAEKVIIPKPDAGDEAWNQFYKKVGVPENFEEYSVEVPEDDGIDQGYFKGFLENAHQAGLLPGQAKKLVDFQVKFATDHAKELADKQVLALEEQIEAFKAEEGDKFNETVYNAKLAIKQFDDDNHSFSTLVEEDPSFGNNPKLIRFLSRIASNLTEDTFRATATSNIGNTAEEAQQKINTIMGDYNGPYYNADHPDHSRVVKEVNKLTSVVMNG